MTENLIQVSQRQNIVNILHSLLDNPTAVHLSSQLTSYQGSFLEVRNQMLKFKPKAPFVVKDNKSSYSTSQKTLKSKVTSPCKDCVDVTTHVCIIYKIKLYSLCEKLQTGQEIIVSTFVLAHKNGKTGGQKDFYATNIFLM